MFLYAQNRLPKRKSRLFNDYLFFLKISPEILDIFRQITSDKIMVKEFIFKICGSDLTLDTVAIFESVEDIELTTLPKPCVIKPAHHSGSVVFVEKGQKVLTDGQKSTLMYALASSPYTSAREGNYRYLRARLICEPMLPEAELTKDYKIFCYKGIPRLVQVDSERHANHKRNIYKVDWTALDIKYNFQNGETEPAPDCLSEMLKTSQLLSSWFEFARIDFFVSEGKFYVGEITHCPESAHGRFGDIQNEKLFSEILFSEDTPAGSAAKI